MKQRSISAYILGCKFWNFVHTNLIYIYIYIIIVVIIHLSSFLLFFSLKIYYIHKFSCFLSFFFFFFYSVHVPMYLNCFLILFCIRPPFSRRIEDKCVGGGDKYISLYFFIGCVCPSRNSQVLFSILYYIEAYLSFILFLIYYYLSFLLCTLEWLIW